MSLPKLEVDLKALVTIGKITGKIIIITNSKVMSNEITSLSLNITIERSKKIILILLQRLRKILIRNILRLILLT